MENNKTNAKTHRRTRIVRPYPVQTITEALTIASAIYERNAGRPFERVLLAKALGTTEKSSSFTQKLNASQSYGITIGGYSDYEISLTELGQSIVEPRVGLERQEALLSAVQKPKIFRTFYKLLNGKTLPEEDFARNLLKRELGIHATLTKECLSIIKTNGIYTGIIREGRDKTTVELPPEKEYPRERDGESKEFGNQDQTNTTSNSTKSIGTQIQSTLGIYICHAGNTKTAIHIQSTLEQFEIANVIVECDFDSTMPIPNDTLEIMRKCKAGIFICGTPKDEHWIGRRKEKREEKLLYQIGAGSVLFNNMIVVLKDVTLKPKADEPVNPDHHDGDPDLLSHGLNLLEMLHKIGAITVSS